MFQFYGPRIGALFCREGVQFSPVFLGGGQEFGRRAGTANTPMIAGLGHAAKLVAGRRDSDGVHLSEMLDCLISSLKVRNRKVFKDSE